MPQACGVDHKTRQFKAWHWPAVPAMQVIMFELTEFVQRSVVDETKAEITQIAAIRQRRIETAEARQISRWIVVFLWVPSAIGFVMPLSQVD